MVHKRQQGQRFRPDGCPMFTLTACDIHGILMGCRIRKLMPKECLRLQGFADEQIDKMLAINSDNPNAIGYASLASVKDTVKLISVEGVTPSTKTIQDGSYKIQRNFVMVTKKNAELSPAAKSFFEFATSSAADEWIIEAGAVPVKR